MYMHKFVNVHAHFNFALLRKFYGVFSTYKNKSFVKTCRHMPLSAAAKLPPPPRRRQAAADLALSRCRHRRCLRPAPPFVGWLLRCYRAAATALPPPSCCRRRAFALPPPPRRRQAAADLALSRCRHRRCRRPAPHFVGWLLRCCPPSDFVVIAKKCFIVPHRNPNTRAQ
jgi:hypothetical protein